MQLTRKDFSIKMRSGTMAAIALLCAFVWDNVHAEDKPRPACTVCVEGPFGAKLDQMIRNHVVATDAKKLAALFGEQTRETWWQTEFWGKYMHAAVPLWRYSGSRELGDRIAAGVKELLPHQEPGGYLGNYPDAARCGRGWDVWGMKYTMMGLMHWFDATKDAASLDAAKRVCDYLIGEIGPGGRRGRPIRFTGNYGGLPSCSVLEPVVWLYKRTGDKRYLDFASYIVKEMTEYPDGPQLVKLASVPVADRRFEVVPECHKHQGDHALTKAYELMSCYQGLLEYHEVTGRKDLLDAAVATARNIAETEINLAGGAAAGEHWFHGADQQYRHISWQQETCVITTWMRLCEKLLALTHDPYWGDQLEKTFYNAYLASMNAACDTFAAYTPLMGYRAPGHHHCRLHTNCCNANGPRGWLTVLNQFFTAQGDTATFNFYMSSRAEAGIPSTGTRAVFRVYTLYPCENKVEIWYKGREKNAFTLKLRIPAFSGKTEVRVNGKPVSEEVRPGSYFAITRTWEAMDKVDITFSLPVEMHRLHDHVAFTRGPLCLARDTRFNDGALDDEIRADKVFSRDLATFQRVRCDDPSMLLAVSATLPVGYHTEDPDNGVYSSTIHFTDYASAGNLWRPDNRYRVWLPELIPGRTY